VIVWVEPVAPCVPKAASAQPRWKTATSTPYAAPTHVGVVVDDLDAVAAFFIAPGFERDGGTPVEGEINGARRRPSGRGDGADAGRRTAAASWKLAKSRAGSQQWRARLAGNRLAFRHIATAPRRPQG
jgi:hypothetical protein